MKGYTIQDLKAWKQAIQENRQFRSQKLNEAATKIYDIAIIGGGATGLGIALDASLRGLKVVLLEKGDWANGASSNSTKLIHGGVRYLEKAVKQLEWAQYLLVKEALAERSILSHIASDFVSNRRIILPTSGFLSHWYYFIGLKCYDAIANWHKPKGIPSLFIKTKSLSQPELRQNLPFINENIFSGGSEYQDGYFDDALFAAHLAKSATEQGADLFSYVEARAFQCKDNQILLQTTDLLNSEKNANINTGINTGIDIRAHWCINCAGVQSDTIRKMINPDSSPRLRPSKGVHLVVDAIKGIKANQPEAQPAGMLIPQTADGRIIFVLPWFGKWIIGATDTPVNTPEKTPVASPEDINYLLQEVNPYLSQPLTLQEIESTFAGNRPLVAAANEKNNAVTQNLIRSHEIEVWKNLRTINVLGGKWTTYRIMASDTMDAFADLSKQKIPTCTTHQYFIKRIQADTTDEAIQLIKQTMVIQIQDLLLRRKRLHILAPDTLKEITKQWEAIDGEITAET